VPQPKKNNPDWIDVQNILGVLGEEYKMVVYFTTRLRGDRVETIGKAYGAPYTGEGTPELVALVTFPRHQPKDMVVAFFTLAWDIWCQADGGGATAASRGAPTSWSGYPEVPRRRGQ
jgi:hypothetical protein